MPPLLDPCCYADHIALRVCGLIFSTQSYESSLLFDVRSPHNRPFTKKGHSANLDRIFRSDVLLQDWRYRSVTVVERSRQ